MNRLPLFAVAMLACCPAAAQTPPEHPDRALSTAAQLRVQLAQAKAENRPSDISTSKLVVSANGLPVMLEYRAGDRQAEPAIHPTQAELIQVIEGDCIFVLGGRPVGATVDKPGGSSTVGGTPIALHRGDNVFVPANIPHWFTHVHRLAMLTLHIPVVPH